MDYAFAGKLNGKIQAIGYILLLPTYQLLTPVIVQGGLWLYLKYIGTIDYYTLLVALNIFSTLISFTFAVVLFKDFLIDSFNKFKEKLVSNIIWCVSAGYGINLLVSYLSNALITLILGTSDTASNQLLIESMLNEHALIVGIQAVVFAPILEELVFRGLIFRTFRKYNIYLGHFISAFLFGFIHIYEGLFAGDLTQLVYLLSYGGSGLAFSFIYEQKKTIIAPIIVHLLNNLIAVLIITLV